MASNSIESYITGHHVYKRIWTPKIGEKLHCEREPTNRYDPNAVTVMKEGKVVGRVAKEHAAYFNKCLREGKTVVAQVTGKRENRRGNGLKVPAIFFCE